MEIKKKVDLKDLKILRQLDMDARMGMNELAKRAGVSRQVAEYRLERMKKDGIILGAVAVCDSATVGQHWFRAVFQLGKISQKEKQDAVAYLSNHPRAMWLGEAGGNWDFVINLVVKDQFEFDRVWTGILEKVQISKYEVLTYINVRDQPRDYLLPKYEVNEREFFHEMKDANIELDETDRKILSVVARDAWASSTQIGAKLGLNYKTVQNRIKELEMKKIILGYRLLVHPRVLGYEPQMLFLGIHSHNMEMEKQLNEFLRHPNVTFVVKQLGRWRIGLEAEFKSPEEFQTFLVELRTRFGEVISEYETFPIFRDHLLNYFPEGALNGL